MEALWERAPRTAAEVIAALRPHKSWAENTVRTLLTRLVEKRALRTSENASGTRLFEPAVRREECVAEVGKSFLQRVFRGAATPLLIHFAQNAELTPDEVEELKRLLDQSVKKKD